jgi:hypothetical protein
MQRSQDQRLGSIVILHAGHPLVGQLLPVVRRYRERGEPLWVIELLDGSRQYVPAAWCTPLASMESLSLAGTFPVGQESCDAPASRLTLAALRDLALLVRHLRERVAAQREEHADDAAVKRPYPEDERPATTAGASASSPATEQSAAVGEFPVAGAPPATGRDCPDGAPAGPRPCGGEGVTQ